MRAQSDVVVQTSAEVLRSCSETETDDSQDGSSSDAAQVTEMDREILALCLRGNRLGCARYRPLQCRVEVFQVPVFLGVELTTNGGGCGAPSRKGQHAGAMADPRVLSSDDIPPSLLWLCQYVGVHSPIALLPDGGATLLADILNMAPDCTVLRLSAQTGFNDARALPQLCAMYPHVTEADLLARFNPLHTAMMGAMAALLQYVSTLRLNVADVVERGPVSVVYMSADTLRALQIMRLDTHPCSAHKVSQSKEGLSLFSVLDHTKSAMGRALLRHWLLLPSCDVEEIKGRQEVVALFLAPQHHEVLGSIRAALRGFHSTNHIFTLIRRGKAHRHHYQTLHRTLQTILVVHQLVAPIAHESPLLFDLVANHCRLDALRDMVELLQRAIHGVCGDVAVRHCYAQATQQVQGQSRGVAAAAREPALRETMRINTPTHNDTHLSINSEADRTGTLGELRFHLESLGNALEYHAREAFDLVETELQQTIAVRCVYISPYGYLLCASRSALCDALHSATQMTATHQACEAAVRRPSYTQADEHDGGGSEHESWAQTVGYLQNRYGWTLHHEDGGADFCYFKTVAMSDLDAKVGDLQRRIVERECELRRDVDETLLFLSLHVLSPCRALATLDCLCSLAHVAQQYQWCRPVLVESKSGLVDVDGGWHPVLCRAVGSSALQPFSIRLGAHDAERVCVVTGQNGTGKSVLLSSIALMVVLTQIGSYVPASSASLSIFSSIWTASQCLNGGAAGPFGSSSFANECLVVNRILRYCDAAQVASADATRMRTHDTAVAGHDVAQSPQQVPPTPLVLLDEFGKGTAAEDGRALLGSVIRYLSTPTLQATVLCTTHHLEMLWDHAQQTAFPQMAFPYERIMLVDMRGEPVYDGGADPEGKNAPVDYIPTFHPHVVTPRPHHHEDDFLAYQSQLFADVAVGADQIGLPSELLQSWQTCLAIAAKTD